MASVGETKDGIVGKVVSIVNRIVAVPVFPTTSVAVTCIEYEPSAIDVLVKLKDENESWFVPNIVLLIVTSDVAPLFVSVTVPVILILVDVVFWLDVGDVIETDGATSSTVNVNVVVELMLFDVSFA